LTEIFLISQISRDRCGTIIFIPTKQTSRSDTFIDTPTSVIEKYIEKGVKPRLADIYKGMGVYEFPSTAINDGTHFNFNGDVAVDTYHKTDIDV